MRRVKPDADTPGKKSSKGSVSKPIAGRAVDEDLKGPKPGLESPYPHIAQDYAGRHNDLAQELTRALTTRAARRVGVIRRER